MANAEQIAKTLSETYLRVFNQSPPDNVRVLSPAEMDDRMGNPTEAVLFGEFVVYETMTDEKDIRGESVKKVAIDTAVHTYSHDSGWDSDTVEVGLYDSVQEATIQLMGIIARGMADNFLEGLDYGDDLDPDEGDPGDMDGDLASGLASAGMGTDEDYEHGTPSDGYDEF